MTTGLRINIIDAMCCWSGMVVSLYLLACNAPWLFLQLCGGAAKVLGAMELASLGGMTLGALVADRLSRGAARTERWISLLAGSAAMLLLHPETPVETAFAPPLTAAFGIAAAMIPAMLAGYGASHLTVIANARAKRLRRCPQQEDRPK